MITFQPLICNFLTWDVGLGDKALFWDDFWDGLPPISTSPFPKDLKEKLVSQWVIIRLKSLWKEPNKGFGDQWKGWG